MRRAIFLGLKIFYHKFIQSYSKLILPLTQHTKKGQSFVWTTKVDSSFVDLKKAFTSVYVPNGSSRLQVVQNFHDTYTAGHFGSTKTLDLVARSFWCDTC